MIISSRPGKRTFRSLRRNEMKRCVPTGLTRVTPASRKRRKSGIKSKLAEIKSTLPENFEIAPINDQSLFVRAAISGVAVEGIIAAALTT